MLDVLELTGLDRMLPVYPDLYPVSATARAVR